LNPVTGSKQLEAGDDYVGRRVWKKVSMYNVGSWMLERTIAFTYAGWNLIKEQTTAGGTTSTDYYVWGLDLSGSLQGAGGIGGLLSKTTSLTSKTFLYIFDANGNVGQLVDASDGSLAAVYEYDPFSNLLVATGPEATNNPFRFSTKYYDAEGGLYYYGYRYYSPELGRWMSRDPIGEDGGRNLYGYVENNPIGGIDLYGLSTREDIDKERLDYSCHCGWIDWTHATPGAVNRRQEGLLLWDYTLGVPSNKGWAPSATGRGFLVKYGQTMYPDWAPWFKVGIVGEYFVKYDLLPHEQKAVALGIFKEVSEGFERAQGPISSSFSVEDLPSDLIAFYRAVKRYDRPEIESKCGVVSNCLAKQVWDRAFGRDGNIGKQKNDTWMPVNFNEYTCLLSYHTCVCPKAMQWPGDLDDIKEVPKGDLWRYWGPQDQAPL
jgi:RHS repeat-associated protein